jgi:hypothetical protein
MFRLSENGWGIQLGSVTTLGSVANSLIELAQILWIAIGRVNNRCLNHHEVHTHCPSVASNSRQNQIDATPMNVVGSGW